MRIKLNLRAMLFEIFRASREVFHQVVPKQNSHGELLRSKARFRNDTHVRLNFGVTLAGGGEAIGLERNVLKPVPALRAGNLSVCERWQALS